MHDIADEHGSDVEIGLAEAGIAIKMTNTVRFIADPPCVSCVKCFLPKNQYPVSPAEAYCCVLPIY